MAEDIILEVDYNVIKEIITEKEVYYIILEKSGLFIDRNNFIVGEKDEILNFLKERIIRENQRGEKNIGYDEWHKEYLDKKIVNVKNELDTKDLKILSKLNIKIKDKVYTEYELETLTIEVGAYYKDDDMSILELEYVKDLKSTGVTQEEYNYISEKIDKIYDKFSKYFAKFCPTI